jgi:transposase
MLTLPSSVQVHVAVHPIDMRKGFDGLAAAVRERVRQEPESGHLFVFRSRDGRLIKVLFWDRTGWVLVAKRLVRGTFRLPVDVPDGASAVQVEAAQLALMLEGIDLRGATHRKRWTPVPPGLRV